VLDIADNPLENILKLFQPVAVAIQFIYYKVLIHVVGSVLLRAVFMQLTGEGFYTLTVR